MWIYQDTEKCIKAHLVWVSWSNYDEAVNISCVLSECKLRGSASSLKTHQRHLEIVSYSLFRVHFTNGFPSKFKFDGHFVLLQPRFHSMVAANISTWHDTSAVVARRKFVATWWSLIALVQCELSIHFEPLVWLWPAWPSEVIRPGRTGSPSGQVIGCYLVALSDYHIVYFPGSIETICDTSQGRLESMMVELGLEN